MLRPFLAVLALATASLVSAQEQRLTPADQRLLPVAPAGPGTSGLSAIELRILSGDPTKDGPYTISIRVSPNTQIAAHTHRDHRTAVVASGLWHFGYGSAATPAALKALPAGSFYTEPAAAPHFASTGKEGATVIISGWGPTDTHYVAQ